MFWKCWLKVVYVVSNMCSLYLYLHGEAIRESRINCPWKIHWWQLQQICKQQWNGLWRNEQQRNMPDSGMFSSFLIWEVFPAAYAVSLQGSNYTLFDPEIASANLISNEEFLFGAGNLTFQAIEVFKRNHHCNKFCIAVGLQPFPKSQIQPVVNQWEQ